MKEELYQIEEMLNKWEHVNRRYPAESMQQYQERTGAFMADSLPGEGTFQTHSDLMRKVDEKGNFLQKIGVISDLHVFHKTAYIEQALKRLQDVDILLLVGDIADRGEDKQYDILLNQLDSSLRQIPVYCVSGNHDTPGRNDTNYRRFEQKINNEYPSIADECGAFYQRIHEEIDLIGLNPVYHQKQFFFPDKGRQLGFLQERLETSPCSCHLVMCHPPLIAHNPQRSAGMAAYIAAEQDRRLQNIIDENRNLIFLSGHTHLAPTFEFDEIRNNLYLNDGSICPTAQKENGGKTQQGNVTLLDINSKGISVTVKGIYSEKSL